jgi:AAA15 family ATPase/GTPase
VGSFTLDANLKDCEIRGANAVGKTTVYNAFCFLLYGLDSTGHTFLPKPIDASGESKHGIESSVEAIFMFDDNSEITLSKSFKELWVKKRGSAKKVFTGHTTKYSIDGVPDILEKDYKKRLAEIAPEHVFKLLTNVRYFPETLHWQDRRQILLDICDDISDTDIIASDKKLSRMPEILNGKTLEEQKKIITARKTKLNKELETLPVRIDEVSKGQPDITGLDLPTIEKALSELSIIKSSHRKKRGSCQNRIRR